MAFGIPDLWDTSIAIPTAGHSSEPAVTWSPCGQFVATRTEEAVEIRDALTFELLSTLQSTEPTSRLTGTIACSPDGRSLCVSDTTIIIWDIQTGGVAKSIQCDETYNIPPVWSLDGKIINTILSAQGNNSWTVREYNVASGTASLPITFQSQYKPHLWAHEGSFRVMTTTRDGEVHTVDISEVGPSLTKIESFPIQLGERDCWIESFSPTTYRISISIYWNSGRLLILDIRNSGCLLDDGRVFSSHDFSSDGGLFAASRWERVHIWKYNDGRYTPWSQLPFPALNSYGSLLRFSPTSSSILSHSSNILRLWRLDGPALAPVTCEKLGFVSRSGTYVATARRRGRTVAITNLLSRTPSQSIDPGMEVEKLALTGNVLLVLGSGKIRAWQLTEEGVVVDVSAERRTGRDDIIWTESGLRYPSRPTLKVGDHIGLIVINHGRRLYAYDTRTGKLCSPAQALLHCHSHSRTSDTQDYFHNSSVYDNPSRGNRGRSTTISEEGWVRGPGEKHQLWLPAELRTTAEIEVYWHPDTAIVKFLSPRNEPTVIKIYNPFIDPVQARRQIHKHSAHTTALVSLGRPRLPLTITRWGCSDNNGRGVLDYNNFIAIALQLGRTTFAVLDLYRALSHPLSHSIYLFSD